LGTEFLWLTRAFSSPGLILPCVLIAVEFFPFSLLGILASKELEFHFDGGLTFLDYSGEWLGKKEGFSIRNFLFGNTKGLFGQF